jgi:demethylmenaquinone methyltransferase / 2-methoxy-6-polyprenyl-1,4-benzoquinol methylase
VTTRAPAPTPGDRFEPRATQAMARMFDDVSGRYDLLNRLMTLGRDASWREAMVRQVPDDARVVLDLCTGNGVSLDGLRAPGRVAVGMDSSMGMLRHAIEAHGRMGWAPRFLCGDAFRIPLRDGVVDAITIAFGVRNLRPRVEALREMRRVLAPDGTLVVLEALAPTGGPLAPAHRLWVRRVIPLAGKLSPDPSAYEYLSRSILEFGSAEGFSADLCEAGFEVIAFRSFLLGATGLWVAMPTPELGHRLQSARVGEVARGRMPTRAALRSAEWRRWTAIQLAVSVALLVGLILAWLLYHNSSDRMPLDMWQRRMATLLLDVALVGFGVRSVLLAWRLLGPPPRF